jgi:3-oxoacyl-[acyl-carrier-protein] synthase-3
MPAGGSRMPSSAETVRRKLHYVHQDGPQVFKYAVRKMYEVCQLILDRNGLKPSDLDVFIPHQANRRIIEAAARGLEIPMDRMMVNLDRYGNTSTASIPIATCEAIEQGRLKAGDRTVFVAFGGGLTWGAAVAQWTGPFPSRHKVRPRRYRWLARLRSLLSRLRRHVEGWIWGRGNNGI